MPLPEQPGDRSEELRRAAADLAALAEAHEACRSGLDDLEAVIDALLDDPHWCVLVVERDLRIRAASRGMAEDLALGPAVVGRKLTDVTPETWHRLAGLLPAVPHDAWADIPVDDGDGGILCARRATDRNDDPIYVVRYEQVG